MSGNGPNNNHPNNAYSLTEFDTQFNKFMNDPDLDHGWIELLMIERNALLHLFNQQDKPQNPIVPSPREPMNLRTTEAYTEYQHDLEQEQSGSDYTPSAIPALFSKKKK